MPPDVMQLSPAAAACDNEPIHIPGAIQPHGALLAAELSGDLPVVAASANLTAMLGGAADPLDRPLAALLGLAYVDDLRRRLEAGDLAGAAPWETTVQPPGTGDVFQAEAHTHADLVIIELEPADPQDEADSLAAARELHRWIGRMRAEEDAPAALAAATARAARALTGYDRALVYQFDAAWNGEAIAEDKAPDWEQSFLNLHFPASDIPAQARALYAQAPMRGMPRRDYEAVPLRVLPGRNSGGAVDLSFARLRSMSPVHRAYHRNMGVDGSMSVSLLSGGKLWGLLVLHHRGPLRVSPGRRAALAAVADAFALRLGPAGRAEAERARRTDLAIQMRLLERMAQQGDVAALASGSPTVLDLFGASGAAVVLNGVPRVLGAAPPVAEVAELAEWLRAQPEAELFCTDALPASCPVLRHRAAEASGLMAVFIGPDRRDMLLWFRPEEPRTVAWGGDPRKPVEAGPGCAGPRASFDRWVEQRHGVARPWAEWEKELACGLRHAIAEVLLRHLRRVAELGEQLRQAQKMEAVGQLTGGLAHDFNNLLTGITGSLELLGTRLAQGRLKDADRYINAAQGAARRAATLTHRLLAFSRRQTLDPRPTDVNRLVAGMEELIRRTVGPAIAVEVVAAGGLWTTLVDSGQLENALLNLCINARDAMPDGGRLVMETSNRWLDDRAARDRDLVPGQYVSLCVSDNGTGMSAEVIANAFDPFFTTKPLGQGTGLGLSMIHGFVRQSGGQARIYSEVGAGTTVCLYLPRHHGRAEASDAEDDVAHLLRAERGETVLIVDDEPTVRMLVAEVLDGLGYTAIEAADGATALRLLQSDARFDLLVTDVGLPGGMNGRQLSDAGRALRPGLKVLFITGYAENAVFSHGHLEPGMRVLTKPFTMEAIGARIRELISGR